MKKIVVSALTFAALSASAIAADLPSRTRAPVAPAPTVAQMSFSGVYVGLVAGYGQYTWHDKSVGNTGDKRKGNGGSIGGTVGYNYQMPNNVVLGVEGDVSWASFKKTTRYRDVTVFGTDVSNDHSDANLFATARVRAGYAINGWIMPYLTGGLAISNSKLHGDWSFTTPAGVVTSSGIYSASKTRTGWTIGGGVEALVTPNVSVKAEYLYADFGTATYSSLCAGCKIKDDLHIGRLGVNYKF